MGQEWRAKEIYLAAAPVSEGMVGSTFYSTLVDLMYVFYRWYLRGSNLADGLRQWESR